MKVSNERDWKVLPTLSPKDSMYYSNDNVLTLSNKLKNFVMENFLNAKLHDAAVVDKSDIPKSKKHQEKLRRKIPFNLRNFLTYRFDPKFYFITRISD